MKLRTLLAGLIVAGAFTAPLHSRLQAQDTTTKKPGGLNKVAHDISATAKKAGRDTKAEVHRDASKAHETLQDAGNATKTAAGDATGIHKVGGTVGDAAQAVSHTGKKAARSTKRSVKKVSSAAHDSLTKAGKDTKEAVKKP